MAELDDHQLLAQFVSENSEVAFATLVERHINLVYSVAWRSVGNSHAAEEVAQAVFIILAQKAGRISGKTILPGWLHQTTRLTAANFLRGEIRRQKREQEAYMQSTLDQPDAEVWPQIAPLLDDALDRLGKRDRNAIVLRFLENKNLREVGLALGTSEDAAKMRVNRALEKLRRFFAKRGVTLSAALIAGAVSANSVQAAPAGLAKTISAVTLAKGATVSISTITLIKETLKLMTWTKMKTAIITSVAILLTAGLVTIAAEEESQGQTSAAALEGTWKGAEVGAPGAISPTIIFKGSTIEFHGTDPREWYRATFTVREDTKPKRLVATITDCPFPQFVGKTGNSIFQIQDGTLTLAGNEPGDPTFPINFDAPGARKFIFKKK